MLSSVRHSIPRFVAPSTARLASTAAKKADGFQLYNWEDALRVETSMLEEDEVAIMETARGYCQDSLAPRVLEAYRNENFDPKILKEMGSLGLLGATIDPKWGCAGVSSVAYGLIAREVERIDSGYRSAMSVQSSLVMHPINTFASETVKEKYLPRLATGELVGCFGLTEPDSGSDPASMTTTATEAPGGGGFILNGAKTWISNAPVADVFVVWAKCAWDGKIRGFVLDKGTKGLSAPQIKNKSALRASITGSIVMEDVHCAQGNMFDTVEGLKGPFSCLNNARFGISFGVVGALEEAISLARAYSLDRKQFGKPIASFQLIQKKLADAHMEAAIALPACVQLGRLKDTKQWNPSMVSLLKRNNCKKALDHSRSLMDIFGGNASSDEYHIARIAANLQTVSTYEGTENIHGLVLGKEITGVAAFA